MPKPLNYELLTKRAVSSLIDLLSDTASRTHGGTKSTTECVACEMKGVHKPVLTCPCACHKARAFLSELSRETVEKAA